VGPFVPESAGRNRNGALNGPNTATLAACATARNESRGEETIPSLLVQSQVCCRLHHSRMAPPRRVELGSGGMVRLVTSLPHRRSGREPDPLERATALRAGRRSRAGEGRLRRVGRRRSAGFPPGVRRETRTPNGQKSYRFRGLRVCRSATSARGPASATTRQVVARPARESRRTRTVFVLLARGAPPLVRSAYESAGGSRTLPFRSAPRDGHVPSQYSSPRRGSTATAVWLAQRDRRSRCWRSLQLSRSYLGATNQAFG
jgi:hypothetical protein